MPAPGPGPRARAEPRWCRAWRPAPSPQARARAGTCRPVPAPGLPAPGLPGPCLRTALSAPGPAGPQARFRAVTNWPVLAGPPARARAVPAGPPGADSPGPMPAYGPAGAGRRRAVPGSAGAMPAGPPGPARVGPARVRSVGPQASGPVVDRFAPQARGPSRVSGCRGRTGAVPVPSVGRGPVPGVPHRASGRLPVLPQARGPWAAGCRGCTGGGAPPVTRTS